jgi:hypothetical protein
MSIALWGSIIDSSQISQINIRGVNLLYSVKCPFSFSFVFPLPFLRRPRACFRTRTPIRSRILLITDEFDFGRVGDSVRVVLEVCLARRLLSKKDPSGRAFTDFVHSDRVGLYPGAEEIVDDIPSCRCF